MSSPDTAIVRAFKDLLNEMKNSKRKYLDPASLKNALNQNFKQFQRSDAHHDAHDFLISIMGCLKLPQDNIFTVSYACYVKSSHLNSL